MMGKISLASHQLFQTSSVRTVGRQSGSPTDFSTHPPPLPQSPPFHHGETLE